MCDICDKEKNIKPTLAQSYQLKLAASLARSLTFAVCDPKTFKRAIIKRCQLYAEYSKTWPNRLDVRDVLDIAKNHFPEEYDKYGIEKLVVLL